MRIFVTGASGFIGGKLCDRLQAFGVDVTCCGRREVKRAGYFRHDLKDPLPNWLNYDVVVHAAARSSPWGTRQEFLRDNVQATQHVIDHCQKLGSPKLVFISSSSVYYRSCDQLGIKETDPISDQPANEYAATKQLAEKLVQQYQGPSVILRPRAVFGPGDTVLLPRILEAARKGKLPLLTKRGEPTIGDLIYIDNLVDYIIQSATRPEIVGDFNLTNNQPVPINAFLIDIFQQLGIQVPKRRVSVRAAMMAATLLELFHRTFMPTKEPPITRFGVHVFAYSKTFDVSKTLAAMGPPVISLEEGVRRTVAELLHQT